MNSALCHQKENWLVLEKSDKNNLGIFSCQWERLGVKIRPPNATIGTLCPFLHSDQVSPLVCAEDSLYPLPEGPGDHQPGPHVAVMIDQKFEVVLTHY